MLNLKKSYRESDHLAWQHTSHGKCSSSKPCTCIPGRAMKNADKFHRATGTVIVVLLNHRRRGTRSTALVYDFVTDKVIS